MAREFPGGLSEPSRHGEADDSGCFGLLDGFARNLKTHQKFFAQEARREDGPFYCPSCLSDAVLKKCTEKADHFAHSARTSPVLRPHEMELHNACTREICDALASRFPSGSWAVERPIPPNSQKKTPKLVPDVSGRIGGQRVVVEVQRSAMTLTQLIQRTWGYAQLGIPLVWIVPLREPLGVEPFRPRLYERYLHSMYFGRTYYWWRGLGLTLKPVHYGNATRHIEYREWVEAGEQQTAGGYDATYKTIKTPFYGPDVDLCEDFKAVQRAAFTPPNERKRVPPCLIWQDAKVPWWETAPR